MIDKVELETKQGQWDGVWTFDYSSWKSNALVSELPVHIDDFNRLTTVVSIYL